MKMIWYGHSSFLLTSENGTRVLIDPYGKFLGYRMPKAIEADLVVVTHNHKDHNQIKVASGNYKLIDQPEAQTIKDVSIRGVRTFHDKHNGAKRGGNICFLIEMDGVVVCHAGDLGHLLTEEQVAEIGHVDVLIVPVGGRMTLNGAEAAQVVRQLKPSVAIPMHYSTKALGLLGKVIFQNAEPFIQATGQPLTSDVQTFTWRKNEGAEQPRTLTFQYAQQYAGQ
ncbi:MBL fold metallo-hydrolase [Paenibacillus rhizovicinus]|uniref:MBL fold metallo-hydrolase n=1 Tax=Paenibacillus rhizovicinus TaxID=2704463 RepID=A0A6C0NZH9_9BACL|nr:MBL fold metallo-hydrolase [Paenibacillus rhizovicinus]QHW29882.1 MBL fold metallo-hydrolase [Paenibacillus rhizovicinus]